MKEIKLDKKFKAARLAAGYSMTEVMRRSQKIASDHRQKITQGYISRIESGAEKNPSLMKILTLCKIYKITPSDFFASL